MGKFVSKNNPIHAHTIKRKATGSVVVHHGGREDVKFTRTAGGWLRERMDVSETPAVVSSLAVANECNTAVGCRESWARVY